ncbi:MAG TPA: TIGR03618 family F420-dependent PPOX class oxidoreductase [Chloroflexota bacterium]|nr:TIGR03618 family F420-dependent PPOX class oxidoreductase [Chloroflexota bacterium]
MADLDLVRSVAGADHYAVIVTPRADGGMQASVVSGGVMNHPVSGETVVALVARGRTVKLANLRRNRRATVVFRNGHSWATVEGQADLIGPDDDFPGFDRERVPQLLRDVFTAAGGTHDNWPEYDRVMAEDRRCAVFIHPERIYGRV